MSETLEILWGERKGVTSDGFMIEIARRTDHGRGWVVTVTTPGGAPCRQRARSLPRGKAMAALMVGRLRLLRRL